MSFLADYRIFTSDNEAPREYHDWSALSALAAVISRKVSLPLGYFSVVPNLYLVLTGAAGVRKTTAMDMARDMVQDWGDIPYSAECITKQAITLHMASDACLRLWTDAKTGKVHSYSPYNIYSTELSHFIGTDPHGMIDFLVTIYDRNYHEVKTKGAGTDIIQGPYLNLISCTTPDWIRTWMRDEILTGGFCRRALFIYFIGEGKRVPVPFVSPEMWAARQRCLDWGEKLKKVSGEFIMTPDALDFYKDWYMTRKIPTGSPTEGYHQSKHIQMFKVAMLLALSETLELVIEKRHLEEALEMLAVGVEKNLEKVFEGIGRNELAGVAAVVMQLLESADRPVMEREIRALTHARATSTEQMEIFKTLEDQGKLVVMTESLPNGRIRRWFTTQEIATEIEEKKKRQDGSSEDKPPQPPSPGQS